MIPRLVAVLKAHAKHRAASLKLLYHLSLEDRTKPIFAHTGQPHNSALGDLSSSLTSLRAQMRCPS
jgi:hypothetical protein